MTYEEAAAIAAEFECAVCGGRLVVPFVDGEFLAVCGKDRSHEGYRAATTATQAYRQGQAVDLPTANAIERVRPPVTSVETLASIWKERQGTLSRAAAYQAALFSLQVGLDPRFGEITCLEFGQRAGGARVPTVMITTVGWRRLAARHAPDLFREPPVLTPVLDPQRKVELGADPDDWVALARGRLKGDPEEDPEGGRQFWRVAWGRYRKDEWERDRQRRTPGGLDPLNQAMRRAERHWYEWYLSVVVERARSAWQLVAQQLDLEGAERVIEAEFRLAEEAAPPAPPPQGPAAALSRWDGGPRGGMARTDWDRSRGSNCYVPIWSRDTKRDDMPRPVPEERYGAIRVASEASSGAVRLEAEYWSGSGRSRVLERHDV